MVRHFLVATATHGWPSRIRVDHGSEAAAIKRAQAQHWPEKRNPVIEGPSVHNTRIEGLWNHFSRTVGASFRAEFFDMERSGILDSFDPWDLFSLQSVFAPRLSRALGLRGSELPPLMPVFPLSLGTPIRLRRRLNANVSSVPSLPSVVFIRVGACSRFTGMWNRHSIVRAGVPNELFLHARRFEEDDVQVDELGAGVFGADPEQLRREPLETDVAPPAAHDPLYFEFRPDLTRYLVRLRGVAMAMADEQHGFMGRDVEAASRMEFQFFVNVTRELRGLVDGLPNGVPAWPSRAWVDGGAAATEFGRLYLVRWLIRCAALRVQG